jgi:hypothetical protein
MQKILIQRRRFSKLMCIMPLGVIAARAFGISSSQSRDEHEHRFLAVRVLRLLNTLELWFQKEHGRYGSMAELLDSPGFTKLKNTNDTESYGIAGSLIPRVSFLDEEIIPGWKLRVRITPHDYTITINDADSGYAFATDEKGVIYTGVPVADSRQDDYLNHAAEYSIAAARPIGALRTPWAKFRRATVRVAGFMLMAQLPECTNSVCEEFRCSCCCSCNEGTIPGLCHNCGCQSCVWCCCPYV